MLRSGQIHDITLRKVGHPCPRSRGGRPLSLQQYRRYGGSTQNYGDQFYGNCANDQARALAPPRVKRTNSRHWITFRSDAIVAEDPILCIEIGCAQLFPHAATRRIRY